VNIEFLDPVLPSRRAWMGVLALGALAAVLFAGGRIREARVAALQGEARARAAAAVVLPVSRALPPPYAEDLKRALDRAALPEAVVLKELEMVAVVGIQLTSIDLDSTSHVATVELRADDERALGDYLDQLNIGQPAPVWHIERLASSQPDGSTEVVTLVRRF
jgi:hypothetical protein